MFNSLKRAIPFIAAITMSTSFTGVARAAAAQPSTGIFTAQSFSQFGTLDATGDETNWDGNKTDSRGDIGSAYISQSATSTTLTMTMVQPVANPAADPAFLSLDSSGQPASYSEFLLDTNGDDQPDYVAATYYRTATHSVQTAIAPMASWDDEGKEFTNPSCVVTPTSFSPAIVATFTNSCIPQTSDMGFITFAQYDTAPATVDPADNDIVFDSARDDWKFLYREGVHYDGYFVAAQNASGQAFGDAPDFPGMDGAKLNKPVVSAAMSADRQALWMLGGDGGVFTMCNSCNKFYGSTGNLKLNKPAVGMESSSTGNGYWFVASDGGIFSFGDTGFYGSMGGAPLNKPVVAMTRSASGKGYYLVASDGGIFAFGDAAFYGSTGSYKLNSPIVGMTITPSGKGYWMVAADGGIFTFGDAGFYGSLGSKKLAQPVVGIASSRTGKGYLMLTGDGIVTEFGDATWYGDFDKSTSPAAAIVRY